MAVLSKHVLSELIGAIYDCVLDPNQWERTLASIAHALECERAILSLNDLRRDRILINKCVGWTPYWLEQRGKHLPWIHEVLTGWLSQQPSLDEPFIASRVIPARELEKDPYVQECLKPLNIADVAHFFLISTPSHFSELVLFRQDRPGIFTAGEIELGALLLPHLRRAVTISNVLDIRTIEQSRMAEALDVLRLGVVLTNEQGAILHANRSAERMLLNGDPIGISDGILRAASPRADQELHMAIRLAAQDESAIGKAGAAIRLMEANAPPVFAHVLPMAGGELRTRLRPEAVAAVFIDGMPDDRSAATAMAASFGLTVAETRLVEGLFAGSSLFETASALEIARSTARTHLNSIFRKTGVSRQAELIRLMMRIVPPGESASQQAYRDREPFMAALAVTTEPIAEHWPHYIEKFQVLLKDRKPKEAVALLTDLLPHLSRSALKRTELCILAATVLEAKWNGDSRYTDHLRAFLVKLRRVSWPMVLSNLPELLAELIGDALDHDIEAGVCRSMIRNRQLVAPSRRPASWPWPIKVHVLGGFRLERDGKTLDLGTKPPTRALDILRALAISPDQSCSLETLQDRIWPDLDGDRGKAACEQALYRLRKLLGLPDLVIQREGALRLAAEKVWVDLAAWEGQLKHGAAVNAQEPASAAELERVFFQFLGPLLFPERVAAWSLPVAERVRSELIDLVIRLGRQYEARGDAGRARSIYLRALDFYPESAILYKALIQECLARNDTAGAIEDYSRYERTLRIAGGNAPSPDVRSLVHPLLAPSAGTGLERVSDS